MSAPPLSPTMQHALDVIGRHQGLYADKVPGGLMTVRALMRRGLVEIAGDKDWRVYLPEHRHAFKPGIHADGCHWFANSGRCECGVMYSSTAERSLKADPYSAVWMDDMGTEKCERCQQLIDGARPKFDVVIYRP